MLARPLGFAGRTALGFSLCIMAASSVEAADAPPLQGTWKILINGERDYILEIDTAGEKVSGAFVSPRSGRYPIASGKYSGGKLRIEVPRKQEETTRVFVIEAEWKGERFEGTLHVDGNAEGTLTLTREKSRPSIAGKWKVVSKTSDGTEYASNLELGVDEGKVRGKASSDLGTFELHEPMFDEGKLTFGITLPIQGSDTAFVVTAALEGENRLAGRWKVRDADISGEWLAEREAPPEKKPEPAKASQGFEGEWFGVSTHADGQKRSFQLVLKPHGDSVEGILRTEEGNEHALEQVKVEGSKLTFSIRLGDTVGTVEGDLKDGALAGKWSIPSGEGGEWKGRKPASF